MSTPIHFDIALFGGGLAGLSLLWHLDRSGKLGDYTVGIIDPDQPKTAHDRTWSFWEAGRGPFDHLVHHEWPEVEVLTYQTSSTCVLAPYAYKIIHSNALYGEVNKIIEGARSRVQRVVGRVGGEERLADQTRFVVDSTEYTATYVFDSRPHPVDFRETKHPYLDQHFRGWFIRTEQPTFDPRRAHLMDFRTPQEGETRFFYVLPTSETEAMVEIAVFSNNHLTIPEYDRLIENYVQEYWTNVYAIEHTEGGNIPMTTHPFPLREGNHIYIGLGGGAARPSTGYTFYGLQRQLARVAASFPDLTVVPPWGKRQLLQDATILRILQEGSQAGDATFASLFAHNPPARVLAFLNGEASLLDELRLMQTTNIPLFGKTFLRELVNFV